MSVARYEMTREKSKRPQLSCNSCRARKVKCDRLQPCSACSLHQISDQCQYDLMESDRKPILQAEALRAKDREIAWLKQQIEHLGGSPLTSDPLYDRKKRKMGTSNSSRISRAIPQQPTSGYVEEHHATSRCSPVISNMATNRSYKRSKYSMKCISIPSPEETNAIAMRGPMTSPQWHEPETPTQWTPGLKRSYTTPTYHVYDGTRLDPTEAASSIKEEPSATMELANCNAGDQFVLAQHPRLWTGCFNTGPESLTMMSTCNSNHNPVSFLPLSTSEQDGLHQAIKSTSNSSHSTPMQPANGPYSTPIQTPSSASCPSSTYAHSASGSSLHTPSASHPVSPVLSQNQAFCMNPSQSQPPSPVWALEATNSSRNPPPGYEPDSTANNLNQTYIGGADHANSAAMIAELAGTEGKVNMGQWQWKMAWAN